MAIDCYARELHLDSLGQMGLVMAVGTFADQADVWLPFDYVDVSVADPSVAHLDAEGRITALDRGTSYVTARRGDVAAATVVTVGPPANYTELDRKSAV